MELEEDGEENKAMSEEEGDDLEAITFGEENNLGVHKEFPPKLDDLGGFSIPCVVGNVRIDRALCDLGASVSDAWRISFVQIKE